MPPTTSSRTVHPTVIVAILCASGIAVSLMQTMIVPLISTLPQILATSNSNAAWALTVTLLVGAITTPIGGRLGDMYGKKLVLLISVGGVVVGSVVCALSNGLALFLVGRGLQGIGVATISLGISIMRDCVPPERLGKAVAAMSASLGVGGALGLPIAAVIAQVTWHALFWVAAAFALACWLGIALIVPNAPGHRSAGFDYLGAVGLSVALTALLLALSKGPTWGWTSVTTLSSFAIAAVVFALWGVYQWHRDHPLVDLRINATRTVALTNVASVAAGFSMFAMTLIPVQILMSPTATGTGNGLSMTTAGLLLAPGGLVMFACSNIGARITARFGARHSLVTGGCVMAAGYIILLAMLVAGRHIDPWLMVVISCITSGAIGIAYAAMPALIMSAVPLRQTGEANGVNALMRVLGTSVSSAVVGMVLAQYVTTLHLPTGHGTITQAFPTSTAYTIAVVISLVACAATVVSALALPKTAATGEIG